MNTLISQGVRNSEVLQSDLDLVDFADHFTITLLKEAIKNTTFYLESVVLGSCSSTNCLQSERSHSLFITRVPTR